MKKYYTLFIDSGIGGISTLYKSLQKTNQNYLYFADNKNAPYGNKTAVFIKNELYLIIKRLTSNYNIKTIVLACNTATTTAISFLRTKFTKISFIGTEPAIKVAKDFNYNSPIVIATIQTIKQLKQKNLSQNLTYLPIKNLATNIEQYFTNTNFVNKIKLLKDIYYIKRKSIKNDCIVLGCTHFCYIKNELQKITKKPIIDGNDGVSKQLCKLQPNNLDKSTIKIILSNNKTSTLQKYKKILKQILANQIHL